MNRRQQVFVLGVGLLVAIVIGATYIYMGPSEDTGKIRVVASFYPLAFFSDEIGGDKVEVRSLIPYNTEVHSWQPSTADIIALSQADVIVYNGAGLDHWFEEDVLPVLDTRGKIVVETTENLTLMPGSGETDHEGAGEGHGFYDPHTWISPYLAMMQAKKVFDALVSTDPTNAYYYSQRWESLKQRLEGLDEDYSSALANKTRGTIFVTHAAFGYLAERYGFTQEGVIGISADEQPSAGAIAEVVEKMAELDTYAIFIDAVYSDDYAVTLKTELESKTGIEVRILTLSLVLGPSESGDYFGQMEENLNNLKIGLGVS